MNIRGIAILEFGVEKDKGLFQIPFLVTGDDLTNTIIGYNTIEYLATNFEEQINLPASLPKVIDRVTVDNVDAMVDLLQEGGKIKQLATEARMEKTTVVYPGCVEKVKCKVKDLDVSTVHNKVLLFHYIQYPWLREYMVDNLNQMTAIGF